jgi:hypothetical protein
MQGISVSNQQQQDERRKRLKVDAAKPKGPDQRVRSLVIQTPTSTPAVSPPVSRPTHLMSTSEPSFTALS